MKTAHKTKKFAAVMMACMMALGIILSNLPALSLTAKAAGPTMSEHFGIPGTAVLQELKSHENDGYYLGTPYRTITSNFATPEACMSPNGNPNGHGPGMNCTGFVAYVLQQCGADLSGIENHGLPGNEANTKNWYNYFIDENRIDYHTFSNVPDLLASGKAEKGDIILCYPVDMSHPDADYHIGFFWGDSPSENKFWHSTEHFGSGNFITEITPKFEPSVLYLMKVDTRTPFDPVHILLQKEDGQAGSDTPQGNAGLAGAQFTTKFYEDEYYSTPEEVAGATPTRTWVFETNVDGEVYFDMSYLVSGDAFYYDPDLGTSPGLPPGTITVQETLAPMGYLLNDTLYIQQITANDLGEIIQHYNAPTVPEPVIRGGVRIEKWDNETNANTPQGGAKLEGTEFDITNQSANPVLVNGTEFAPGAVVATIQTDATGAAEAANDLLPFGDYSITEKTPPSGYLNAGETSRSFSITENGVVVNLNTEDTAIKNNPIRGDIEFSKRAEDMKTMSHIKFSITSMTTGESHNFVTDENGYWSSHSDWNPHSQDTNRGETEYDGLWFGDINALDDSKGALLYDTYLIEELRCEGNEGMDLVSFEVTIRRNMKTIDLGSIFDKYDQPPEIGTTAIDEASGTHTAIAGGQTTIIDTVQYWGLTVGQQYGVAGILMDKATGNPLLVNGEEVRSHTPFTAEKENGTVDVVFTFDSSGLAGKSVVVFETLYIMDGGGVATHEDITDEGQTVNFTPPEIRTTAIDAESGTHTATPGGTTTIIDTVTYSGLTEGQEYTVVGILMDKATEKPVLVNGEEVTASTTFIAENTDGTVDVVFTFDSSGLAGTTTVVFETLYHNEKEVTAHTDIKDMGQTVTFNENPEIGTTAIDAASGTHHATAGDTTTIIDTVAYIGLTVGQEYTVTGVLMDKATGKPLLVDGKEVTASATFIAESADGSVDIAFTFDSKGLEGKTVVVFETMYHNEIEVATHADIEDIGQSVTFKDKPAPTPEKKPGAKAFPKTGPASLWD